MESIQYTVKIHPAEEGGYWAEMPALPGCFTQGKTLEEVMAVAKEAVECHLASLLKLGKPIPVEKHARKGMVFPLTVRAPRLA